MQSKFQCPSCSQTLLMEHAPSMHNAPKSFTPYVILHCGNICCPSAEAANNGGSGPTEEAAYQSLVLAVKHEEDRETEAECEPLSPEEQHERNEDWKAEHANDLARSEGA